MNKKVFSLLLTSLLLIGCGFKSSNTKNSSDSIVDSSTIQSSEGGESSNQPSSSNSEEQPSSSDHQDSSSESNFEEDPSSEESSSTESSEESSSEDLPPEPTYGYGFYDDYYGELTWENGEDLKEKLYNIMRDGYEPISYADPNWETNVYADHDPYNYMWLNVIYGYDDVESSRTQKGWQREHAFPASLMTGSTTSNATKFLGRATDFHNLFAANASGNMSRGNKNYGYADPEAEGYQNNDDVFGAGWSSDAKTFEPGDMDKGRVARAIFYMCTMYSKDENDTKNNVLMKGLTLQEEAVDYVAGNDCHFAIGHLSELLEWNDLSEVDYLEMQHNESVYSHVYAKDGHAQGNRNPYVDYPELVDYVFGDKQNEAGDLGELKPSCIDLGTHDDMFSHYALFSAKTEMGFGETLTKDDYVVYRVYSDFHSEVASQDEYYSTYDDHTFVEGDDEGVGYVFNQVFDEYHYPFGFFYIVLDPMQTCSYHFDLNKSTIDNSYAKVGVNQTVQYDGYDFTVNADVTYTDGDTTKKWTLQNIGTGGFKLGSGTYTLNSFTLTSSYEYTVDKVFIKAYAANQSSEYTLKIYVGGEEVYTSTVDNNSSAWKVYGGELDQAHTGQISFVFEGTNALALHSMAWNSAD